MDSGLVLIGLIALGVVFGPIVISIIAWRKVDCLSTQLDSLQKETQLHKEKIKSLVSAQHQKTTDEQPIPPNQEATVPQRQGQSDQQEQAATSHQPAHSHEDNQILAAQTSQSIIQSSHEATTAIDTEPTNPDELVLSPSTPSIEEKIGTRWAVWVGGVALALGGVFLIRYSLEAGFFGPTVRLTLAAILGFILMGAGEFFRRKELASPISGLEAASIPPILTSAGIVALYGVAYAAFALYGFIGAGTAFAVMAAISALSLITSLLHGPFLAGAGFLGAYATPILASTGSGDIPSLYFYLIAISIPVIILARIRLWLWLMRSVIIATLGWALLTLLGEYGHETVSHALYLIALGLIFSAALFWSLHPTLNENKNDQGQDWMAFATFAALSALAFAHYASAPNDLALQAMITTLVLLQLGLVWQWSAANSLLGSAGLLGFLAILAGPDIIEQASNLERIADVFILQIYSEQRMALILKAISVAALFGGAAKIAIPRLLPYATRTATGWALAGTILPVVTLIAVYLILTRFETSMPFAIVAIGLGLIFSWISRELLQGAAGRGLITAIYIIAALSSGALGLTIAMEKGWLTVALAFTTLGAAFTAHRLKIWQIGPFAALLALIVGIRLFLDPLIVGTDVGRTPIFNWLLWGYGTPALCFYFSASYLRMKNAPSWPTQVLDALSMVAVAALVGFQVRHTMNDGAIFITTTGLAEVAIQSMMALSLSIGYGRISSRMSNLIMRQGSLCLAIIGLVMMVILLAIRYNPALSSQSVGEGHIFNLVNLGYLLPGLLTAWLARESQTLNRPIHFTIITKSVAGLFLFLWLNLTVRHAWQGDNLLLTDGIPDGEFYSYSAAWLFSGILLLVVGIFRQNFLYRKISAALIILAVLKIFVLDTAQLEGVLRALSFIGLGVVLIGIGLLYQRLLFGQKSQKKPA